MPCSDSKQFCQCWQQEKEKGKRATQEQNVNFDTLLAIKPQRCKTNKKSHVNELAGAVTKGEIWNDLKVDCPTSEYNTVQISCDIKKVYD